MITMFTEVSQIESFTRKFTLADDIIVKDAKLEDGMLNYQTGERVIPEEKKPRLTHQVKSKKNRRGGLDSSPFFVYSSDNLILGVCNETIK